MTKRQLISGEEAVPAKSQPKRPCSDCPWSRESLPGWLGDLSAQEWLQAAHGEALIDCHALIGVQCAGVAIYRANVAKLCRSKDILRLPRNRDDVFATPTQFTQHHKKGRTMTLSERAEKAVMEIDDLIDTNYAPEIMSPEEALEFLETIASHVESKIDAIKEENDLQ